MEQDKEYPLSRNLVYCVRATRQGCPRLLVFCLLVILANCLVPVVIAYLPKATVQAAIGSVPLASGLACGKIVLSVAVMAIIITAPLGAFGMDQTYRKFLQHEK